MMRSDPLRTGGSLLSRDFTRKLSSGSANTLPGVREQAGGWMIGFAEITEDLEGAEDLAGGLD
jgi:hypothetical protein